MWYFHSFESYENTRNTKCPILTYPAEKITLPCYACLCFTHVYVVYELPPFPLPMEFKTATPQSFISLPLKFTWKEFMVLLVSLKKKKKPFVLISGCRPAILKWICFGNNPNPTLLIGWLILCLLLLLYILKLQEEAAVVNDSSVYQVTLSEPSSSASNGQQYAVITGLPSTGWCIWLGLGLNIHTFNRLQSSLIM